MEKISRNFKKKTFWHTLIFLVISFVLIVGISIFRKQSSSVVENSPLDLNDLRERTIFGDVKIKINGDIFSHDQIDHEVRENDLISFFIRNVKKGDTIVYVSHDVGVQQLLLAKLVLQSGRIYVFNPIEKYNDAIRLSAQENEFDNRIVTKTVAISDRAFDGALVYKSGDFPESGTIEDINHKVERGNHTLKVRVSSLDLECPNLQNVDLLRISTVSDMENAIRGAKSIIKRSPKLKIIVDYNRNKFESFKECFEDLKKDGFNLYLINEKGEAESVDLKDVEKGHLLLVRES